MVFIDQIQQCIGQHTPFRCKKGCCYTRAKLLLVADVTSSSSRDDVIGADALQELEAIGSTYKQIAPKRHVKPHLLSLLLAIIAATATARLPLATYPSR